MANPDLRDYLRTLDAGEMLTIKKPVPRDFLITALGVELDRRGLYPVLCLEKVGDSEIPVLTNLFAKRERIFRMAGSSEAEFSRRLLDAERNPVKPEIVATGKVQEVIQVGEEVDIRSLPIMEHYKTDAGRYVTSAILVGKDPESGVRNLSYHRLQIKGPQKMGVSLHSRGHLWQYFSSAEKKKHPLEVAAIIGAHPLVMLAASVKTRMDVDEYDIAGSLLGEPLELVRGKTIDVEYPAGAEIVLEGRILPQVNEDEGPFGEFTSYSTSRSTRNVFEIRAVCRRQDPYYVSVAAGASADHLNLARIAKEIGVLNRLQERVANVRNIHYPRSGVNLHCFVSMAPGAEGSVRQALMLLFGLDPNVKLAIAVDQDIDITDEAAVMWALATKFQGSEDMFVVPKVFTIRLDPSSVSGMGSKVGMDATTKPGSDAVSLRLDPQHVAEASALVEEILRDLKRVK